MLKKYIKYLLLKIKQCFGYKCNTDQIFKDIDKSLKKLNKINNKK